MTSNLNTEFTALTSKTKTDSVGDIASLRVHFQELRQGYEPLYTQATGHRQTVQKDKETHQSSLGIREKYLRGWFGGNKGAVQKKDDLKKQLKEIAELHERMGTWMYQLKFDCKDRVRGLVRQADPVFDKSCKEETRLGSAQQRTGRLVSDCESILTAIQNSRNADGEAERANDENLASASQRAENAYDKAMTLVKDWPAKLRTYQQDMLKLEVSVAQVFPPNKQPTGLASEITGSLMEAFGFGHRKTGLEKAKPEMEAYKVRIKALNGRLSQVLSDLSLANAARVSTEWAMDDDEEAKAIESTEDAEGTGENIDAAAEPAGAEAA